MNEKQPFEERISDKLQRLPLPDTESSWQQMKSLLDDKMPRGGGFKPYGRWWWAGMIAIVITAFIWFVDEQYKSDDKLSSAQTEKNNPKNADAGQTKNDAVNKSNSVASSSGDSRSEAEATNPNQKESTNQESVKEKNERTSTLNTKENKESGKPDISPSGALVSSPPDVQRANAGNNKNRAQEDIAKRNSEDYKSKGDKNNPIIFATIPDKNSGSNKTKAQPGSNQQKNGAENLSSTVDDEGVAVSSSTSSTKSPKGNGKTAGNKNNSLVKAGAVSGGNDIIIETSNPGISSAAQQHISGHREPETVLAQSEFSVNTEAAMNEKLVNSSSGSVTLAPAVTKKAAIVASIVNDKSRIKHSGEGFSFKKFFKSINLPYEGENWWAAGLALNGGVATGSQNKYNYNVNAKSGVATDYIPSPYLQYHVNSNLYMQTEFNFSAPQYTSQFLAAQKTTEVPSTNDKILQSTYVQKLYYFNWPVSVYYSPIRNLFFNAGLQFSSLQSGLKIVEERKMTGGVPSPTDPVYNSEVLKFKDDSIAARLTPNEWRWETGANYYLNRFTIGLKYNASFSNLVKIQPSPAVPANDSRNSAFLLFLRYNLWESRKKTSDKNYTSSLFK